MSQFISAFFTPVGRISQGAYIVYTIILTLLIVGARLCHQKFQSGDWPGESEHMLAIMLFLLWPKFCLLSRRLQDCGWSGMYAFPVFALAVFWFLVKLDPTVLGETEESIEQNWAQLWAISAMAKNVLGLLYLYAFVSGGDEGPNAFGPPFGTMEGSADATRDARLRARLREEYPDSAGARVAARMASGAHVPERRVRHETPDAPQSKLGFPKPERVGFGR